MKRARLVVLSIAFAAAGGAAILAKTMISGPKEVIVEKKAYDTLQVLVAKKNIRLGDSVRSSDLGWQPWPKSAAVAGYITMKTSPKAKALYSSNDDKKVIARAPFLKGEPIKEQKLIRLGEGGVLAAILQKGMRAISTPVREETAAGGFILPNDRVDVIVTRRLKSRMKEQHVSETVLTNVRVLAIGQNIETKDGKKVVSGKTATLELNPGQAELLALARSMGDLSLSLRSLADAHPGDGDGPKGADNPFGNKRGGAIKLLKYGVTSQVYGVN